MRPRYYQISSEYEPKLIGVKDGGAQAMLERELFHVKKKYDDYVQYFISYSGDEWYYNQTKFPSFKPDFEYVKLNNSAVLSIKAKILQSNYQIPRKRI